MRALYHIDGNDQPQNEGNTGLWYDKFCDQWPDDRKWSLKNYKRGREEINPKQNWIDTVTGPVGERAALEETRERIATLARKRFGVEPLRFKIQWRFVTGLGREHPVENGFAWHQTLGVPYLPGTSVKGMVRAWARDWLENADSTTLARILGPEGAGRIGSVLFLDALPTDPARLEADVMTPHYAPYYSDGEAPGDWFDPVPVPFLAVAARQEFQFVIAPRRPSHEQDKADAETARCWLRKALQWIGAGAKTAAGYGRFDPVGSSQRIQTNETWEAAMLRLNPGSGEATATHEERTAKGNTTDIENWQTFFGDLSKTQQKKLKSQGIRATVMITVTGNQHRLTSIANQREDD